MDLETYRFTNLWIYGFAYFEVKDFGASEIQAYLAVDIQRFGDLGK